MCVRCSPRVEGGGQDTEDNNGGQLLLCTAESLTRLFTFVLGTDSRD